MNKKKIIRIAAYFSAGLIVAFAVAATKGLFAAGEIPEIRKTASDGCFVASVCLIGFALLLFAGNGGAFDMLAYGVKSVFSVFLPEEKRKTRETFYEYSARRQAKKKPFALPLVTGCGYLVLSRLFFLPGVL